MEEVVTKTAVSQSAVVSIMISDNLMLSFNKMICHSLTLLLLTEIKLEICGINQDIVPGAAPRSIPDQNCRGSE